jgi:hypothetical protein
MNIAIGVLVDFFYTFSGGTKAVNVTQKAANVCHRSMLDQDFPGFCILPNDMTFSMHFISLVPMTNEYCISPTDPRRINTLYGITGGFSSYLVRGSITVDDTRQGNQFESQMD